MKDSRGREVDNLQLRAAVAHNRVPLQQLVVMQGQLHVHRARCSHQEVKGTVLGFVRQRAVALLALSLPLLRNHTPVQHSGVFFDRPLTRLFVV